MKQERKKRLSIWRVLLAVVLLMGIIYGGFLGFQQVKSDKAAEQLKPWYAPYVDVTATPLFAFEQVDSNTSPHNLVLSFIVASSDNVCTPSWGNAYTLDDANAKLDFDRRVARFKQQEGTIAISFGGALNSELAITCTDTEKLKNAYEEVIRRYSVDTLDFDIEGDALKQTESIKRRAIVISELQKSLRAQNKKLAVWVTLPVTPQGLSEDGTRAVAEMLTNKVDLAGVNVMTMDYGNSRDKKYTMQLASEQALNETHRQLGIIFKQAGINLNEASIWAKIGATPMIGQNDIADEIFTLQDAKGLNEFVISKRIARLSIWSANRDIQCGENYVNTSIVSDSCSGIKQEKNHFSTLLSVNFTGTIQQNAALLTKEDPEIEQKPDNPEESPYQIWTQSGTYLEGTKVVWHHNVYQAKWWTNGDLPDNPVLQSWQTPWQLVGPVLPGEKPIKQFTLPPGTYPIWSGTEIYDAGQRILFNGIPYQAKWWTQGDSPAASTANPDSSPWIILTEEQINQKTSTTSGINK